MGEEVYVGGTRVVSKQYNFKKGNTGGTGGGTSGSRQKEGICRPE